MVGSKVQSTRDKVFNNALNVNESSLFQHYENKITYCALIHVLLHENYYQPSCDLNAISARAIYISHEYNR